MEKMPAKTVQPGRQENRPSVQADAWRKCQQRLYSQVARRTGLPFRPTHGENASKDCTARSPGEPAFRTGGRMEKRPAKTVQPGRQENRPSVQADAWRKGQQRLYSQ